MSKPFFFEKPEVNLVATEEEPLGIPEQDTPFRIVLLGDWSGRANRPPSAPGPEIAARNPVLVDRDNFDQLMAKIACEVHLSLAGDESRPLTIRFNGLDDFHPDRIYERIEVFEALKRVRQRLGNPATFVAAADEVRGWTGKKAVPRVAGERETAAPERSPSALRGVKPDGGSLLEQMLEESESGRAADASQPRVPDDLDMLLQTVVGPFLVPRDDPQQAELVAAVDEATAKLMRAILRHPDFQAIEAAWRGLYFLVSRLETDTKLKLYILDVSKAELAADLHSSNDLQATGIYRLLVERTVGTPGAEPWAVLAGNYTFDQTPADVELLSRMARIAQRAGSPFIAAASPHVLGCESLAEQPDPDDWQVTAAREDSQAWESLRQRPEASYLGLALPRFLLRLPYGKETEPVEHFDFEEMDEQAGHENYLWGNPSFVCVYLLGMAFSEYEWDLRPGVIQDIEDLPLHVYEKEGESRIKPCAEALLTMRAAETILEKGIMPLLSFQGSDRIRLARFESLADPPTPLSGRWG